VGSAVGLVNENSCLTKKQPFFFARWFPLFLFHLFLVLKMTNGFF
jgi:hypothetical protein